MSFVEWSMEGLEFVNCNCGFGCPCQFNALPTHGDCRAYGFVQIEKGKFGDVPLDGLRWGMLISWPGAIHEGNGTAQVIIDERADEKQRAAIEAVAQGRETEPGKLIWQIFSTTYSKVLPTLYKPIDLKIDKGSRKAQVNVPGVVKGEGKPIVNEHSGADMPMRITLPNGMEYHETEVISGTGKTANGEISLDLDSSHAHIAQIHWTTHGVVH